MSAEKFLIKLFAKLTEKDYKSNNVLKAFYKFFQKSKSDNVHECYIDFLIRNKQFEKASDKETEIIQICESIKSAILYEDEDADHTTGFINDEERKKSGLDAKKKVKAKITDKKVVKFNKAKALRVISNYLTDSGIVTYEDPDQETTEQDQEFRDATADNIVVEILEDGGKLPKAKPDIEFGIRSEMMNIWRDTENRCTELLSDDDAKLVLSKMYFLDANKAQIKCPELQTIPITETTKEGKKEIIDVILAQETIKAKYTLGSYGTIVKLTNTLPIEEVIKRTTAKIKTLYICAGHMITIGGNADQGLNVAESMLYLTTSYSIALQGAFKAYSLSAGQFILCPNVLVFKDTSFKECKPGRLSVLNAPSLWRPKLMHESKSLYERDQNFKLKSAKEKTLMILRGALELALFFGYDSVVFDDREIEDNQLPAHQIAILLKHTIQQFASRFREILIATRRPKSFDVFKYYFEM